MEGDTHRVGLIVPSSNVTMEAELPALLRARERERAARFTFHAARMRMKRVTPEELRNMNVSMERGIVELDDAAVDVHAFACLVAIMSGGHGHHRAVQERFAPMTSAPIRSSAGALVDALHHLGAKRVALICPYVPALAQVVIDYLGHEGIEVQSHIALAIDDNLAVARRDPLAPSRLWRELDTDGVDAIIASACVQMPSLASIERIEQASGIATLSASVATAWSILGALGLDPCAPGGGKLLRAHNNPSPTPGVHA